MQNIDSLSKEALTAIELIESIDKPYREHAVSILREYIAEVESENRWDELFQLKPDPMISMAEDAINEYKTGDIKKF